MKKSIPCLILILLLCLPCLGACTKAATSDPDLPASEQFAVYTERIAALEAELKRQQEEKYISDSLYEAKIRALESQLNIQRPDSGSGEAAVVYHYQLKEGKATITGFEGTAKFLNLPDTLDGYPVVAIGERAFEGKELTAVVLPEGLETIEWFAFYNCASLSEVSLPASLSLIGHAVFDGCPNVTLCCPAGSYAAQYAQSYGLPLIKS